MKAPVISLTSFGKFGWYQKIYESQKTGQVKILIVGFIYQDSEFLTDEKFADFLFTFLFHSRSEDAISPDESYYGEKLHELNGSFAVIIESSDSVVAASDRNRSFLLFYSYEEISKTWHLFDNPWEFFKKNDSINFGLSTNREYLLTGYVTKADTLFKDVKQVDPGVVMIWRKDSSERPVINRYYEFDHREIEERSYGQLSNSLLDALNAIFDDLVVSLKGRRAVIPLSGGRDSRLIAVLLKERKYDNVLTFTYGIPGSWEARVSRTVAGNLNYPWEFIEYSTENWHQWFKIPQFQQYLKDGGRGIALAHIQDWPAVYEMKRKGVLRDDDIFIPGHSGDFIAGSHITEDISAPSRLDRNYLVERIIEHHFTLWPDIEAALGRDSFSRDRLEADLPDRFENTDSLVASYELWDWRERQVKYIINSVRSYEFWDYEWRLPLWDNRLVEFWEQVPLEYRLQQKLYKDCLDNRIFEKFGVRDITSAKSASSYGIIYSIYRHFPPVLSGMIKKLFSKTGLFEKVHRNLYPHATDFQALHEVFEDFEKTPGRTLNDFLEEYNGMGVLPDSLIEIIEPYRHELIGNIPHVGMLALFSLFLTVQKGDKFI